jgi:Asp-tRNA(Asn)/Glu-tRNA(Gln) amidotransferase C subunit
VLTARRHSSSAPHYLVPREAHWDPRELLSPAAPVVVSDVEMQRLCTMSFLEFSHAELEKVRGDVSAILSAARVLQDALAARTEPLPGGIDEYLNALSEEELETVAEAQWARLRKDEVTEGSLAAEILSSSPSREGAYFSAPKK